MSDNEENPAIARFEPGQDIEGDWEVAELTIYERFDHPGEATIELRSEDMMAEPSQMLGLSATVVIERSGTIHEFSGIIEKVEDGVSSHHQMACVVTLVPALVALRYRLNSRIFQEKTVPEILQEVLDEGLGAFERSVDIGHLSGTYPPQEYTVQYQESDYDFVHRLMQEHGISYHFVSADGAETMTLTDSDSAYTELMSIGNTEGMLPMVLRAGSPGMREDVHEFHRASKLRSTVARTLVYDWLNPTSLYEGENSDAAGLDSANGAELDPEREDYRHDEPGVLSGTRTAGLDSADVDQHLALRRALHQRDAIRCSGVSTATGMAPGSRFELLDHPQAELNEQYVVCAVEHHLSTGGSHYTNRFECFPSDVEWRPTRIQRRPRIPSVQTATVVGPSGEEIYTDEHGRIKVQFHWDRAQPLDETSSCFVRVVQPWAGNGWGFVFLPRIGMEVAVTFIDGDPDRPIVMGAVYNGANATPYGLPDDKTKSTIKTESSPGGGGFNELRFEDAAGSEEIYIHAQKDFNEEVLNDHNTTVGNNQTNNVDVDQTQTVHGNQSETVDGNQEMEVGGNRTVHVVGDFDETIDATETRTVTGDVTETFSANETRTISGDQTETISGSVTHTISGDQTDTVSGSLTETITGGITTTTPANLAITAAGGINMTTSGSFLVNAVGGFTVLAPGGTKTVDVDFWKFGGGQGDIFSWQIGIAGAKLDVVGLAVGTTGTKLEATNIAIGATMAKMENEPMVIESKGQAVALGAIGIWSFGLSSLL